MKWRARGRVPLIARGTRVAYTEGAKRLLVVVRINPGEFQIKGATVRATTPMRCFCRDSDVTTGTHGLLLSVVENNHHCALSDDEVFRVVVPMSFKFEPLWETHEMFRSFLRPVAAKYCALAHVPRRIATLLPS